jgi:hypothetical protein
MVFPSKFRLLYLYGVEIGIQFVKWHVLCRAKVDRPPKSVTWFMKSRKLYEKKIEKNYEAQLKNNQKIIKINLSNMWIESWDHNNSIEIKKNSKFNFQQTQYWRMNRKKKLIRKGSKKTTT